MWGYVGTCTFWEKLASVLCIMLYNTIFWQVELLVVLERVNCFESNHGSYELCISVLGVIACSRTQLFALKFLKVTGWTTAAAQQLFCTEMCIGI